MLFAPGNEVRKVEKVFTFGADVVALDLEDAVPVTEKATAREIVLEHIIKNKDKTTYVRINSIESEYFNEDLEKIIHQDLNGILLPMLESSDQFNAADKVLSEIENNKNIEVGSIDIIPIIETARGFSNIKDICLANKRLKRLSFGAWDFSLDTNVRISKDENEIYFARSLMVIESRAAGLSSPIDTSFIDLEDLEGLKQSALRARNMGFQGKACIHPKQVDIVNTIFSPTESEISDAKQIIAVFERAEKSGSASIRVNNRFIDYATYEKAKRVLQFVD
jgi:citrate lyase subunit beta/citryl-CoA lyase